MLFFFVLYVAKVLVIEIEVFGLYLLNGTVIQHFRLLDIVFIMEPLVVLRNHARSSFVVILIVLLSELHFTDFLYLRVFLIKFVFLTKFDKKLIEPLLLLFHELLTFLVGKMFKIHTFVKFFAKEQGNEVELFFDQVRGSEFGSSFI